jgi:hypothetical protein
MWADVVGAEGAAHCRMAGLRGTEVLADAEAGPWAQELSARRGRIIAEINRRLGGGVVTEIRFRQTGRPLPPAPVSALPRRPGREPEGEAAGAGAVSPDEIAAVERVVAEIGDAEIREGARRAMISQLKWRKGRMASGERDAGEPS